MKRRTISWIGLGYAVFGAAWVTFFYALADRLWPAAAAQGWLALANGLALVGLTVPLLYALLRHVVVAHERTDEMRRTAEGILATMREPLLVLDPALHVVRANDAFYRSFRTTLEETEGFA